MSSQDGRPGDALGLCALCAGVALGIPLAIGAGASVTGTLLVAVLVGVLAAVGALVQTRRARPGAAMWATGLFVLSAGFAVFQVPELAVADAAAGACCLFFVIGLQVPGGDRAGAWSRRLDEFRPALIGCLVATPALIIGAVVPSQPSVLVGIAAGLVAVAVLVALARRMV